MSGKLFSIAPHAPFLQTLAQRVLDGTLTGDWDLTGPFGLADITIILPTRRARQALADAFAAELGGTALLPDMRTFGGDPEEEEPFLPPFDQEALPPAVNPLSRKLILARLIEQWLNAQTGGRAHPAFSGFATPPSAAEILMLAESLGELIDDCLIEGVQLEAVGRLDPGDRSGHWQNNLQFLDLALKVWPEILAERGAIDAAARRNAQLARQSGALRQIFGGRPVIAAGSTGSIPATADLLKAITTLERGALVLPGLDTRLDAANHEALADPGKALHGNAQYGLSQLLRRLGTNPAAVRELASGNAPRTHLLRQALVPPEAIGGWADARRDMEPDLAPALAGVAIAVARTDQEQARAIALAARQALSENKTVGIISPDRNLARRIAAELQRFGVTVDDSAGTPLFQSRAGRLARQLVALAQSDFAPVDLMALLRNRATGLGLERAAIRAAADALELGVLRGQRPPPGIAGLRQALAANLSGDLRYPVKKLSPQEGASIGELLDRLASGIDPLCTLLKARRFGVAEAASALSAAFGAVVAAPDEATPPPEFAQLFEFLAELGAQPTGPVLEAQSFEAALASLMASEVVRPVRPARTDIAIWGQLEARLQNPDLMILAGLSENVWPQAADPGPWLSRAMRLELGLEPPERRQGQAAHDFEMAMGNARVLVTRAERAGTSPATASRLLLRLEAFIGEPHVARLHERGAHWVAAARDLDFTGPPQPALRPAPNPDVQLRPRRLSVTEIETLIRSPYDIYARHVLGLRPIPALGEDPDLSERGQLVHEIFGRFIEDGHDPMAPEALDRLTALAQECFAAIAALPERRVMWTKRFHPMAEKFLAFERGRHDRIAARHAEIKGAMVLEKPQGDFTLSGRADRIDIGHDGRLDILDFKTGAPPDAKDMLAFTAPQLLLEAAIARAGGFAEIPPADPARMLFIKLGFGPDPWVEKPFKLADDADPAEIVAHVVELLSRHVDTYLFAATPMAARIFPKPGQRYAGDYDHLARLGEWASIEGEGEE